MNNQIREKISILIFVIISLIFMINRNLIFLRHTKKVNALEFLKKNNQFKVLELSKSISIFKAFEILRAHQFKFLLKKKVDLDYENINFSVIRRTSCNFCGLFSNYIVYLGCIRKYLIEGFVPILEFESYKNAINGFIVDPSKGNPWEYHYQYD